MSWRYLSVLKLSQGLKSLNWHWVYFHNIILLSETHVYEELELFTNSKRKGEETLMKIHTITKGKESSTIMVFFSSKYFLQYND